MNPFIILGNYFKTSLRNMAKNKVFTTINVVGLAISLSVGLIMLTFINEVNTYDKFHKKYSRIYRVLNTYSYLEEDPSLFASTSVLAGKKIEESVPGIEDITLIRSYLEGDFGFKDKWLPLEGFWATEGFLDIFSFKLIEGDPSTALKEPYSVVITQRTAEKLFGSESPLGKTISLNKEEDFTVTGVIEDPPVNSTIDFEIVGSFSTYEEQHQDEPSFMHWDNMWMFHVYFTLKEGANLNDVQAAFDEISKEENALDEYTKITLGTQAMKDIIPGPSLNNEMGKSMESDMLWMIAGLTFIVIISACFNYTNLSIAKSIRRGKEVGIRKVVGASRIQVFGQFIFEAIIISILALIFATGLFYMIKPGFLELDRYIQDLVSLDLSLTLIIQFILLAVFIGFIAGFTPALVFSKLNPQGVLKGNSSIKMFGGMTLRKVLIVFQFTLSLMFIVAATIEYNQYKYSLSFNLGYNTDNVLNLRLKGNDARILKNELDQLPGVQNISSSLMITSVGNYWGENVKYKDPMDSANAYFNGIDEFYIPLHDHTLLAGQNFNPQLVDTLQIQVIVNEKLLERFNVPKGDYGEKSIGEVIKFGDREAVIVGVIKDFHYGTLNSDIKPFLFRYSFGEEEKPQFLNLKIVSGDMISTMDKIEAVWKKVDDLHPIDATFYEDRIQQAYSELVIMVKIIGFLAFLAITIALMGLLGMVIFTTETRLKEISIRKVLGATEGKLIVQLGKGFMVLLFISAILAIPSIYLLFDKIVFADLVYRANIGVLDLLSGTVLVFLITIVVVGSQTIQAARTNPADTLRNE